MSKVPGVTVAGILETAGFSGETWITAVAIAKAESDFDITAKHQNRNGTWDWGLMQINDVHKPTEEEKTRGIPNARLALKIFRARGSFKDWATYNTGSYKKHIPLAKSSIDGWRKLDAKAKDQALNSGPAQGQNDSFNPLQGVSTNPGDLVKGATDAVLGGLFKLGINAGAVIGGIVLLILGVLILTKQNPIKTAAKVVVP